LHIRAFYHDCYAAGIRRPRRFESNYKFIAHCATHRKRGARAFCSELLHAGSDVITEILHLTGRRVGRNQVLRRSLRGILPQAVMLPIPRQNHRGRLCGTVMNNSCGFFAGAASSTHRSEEGRESAWSAHRRDTPRIPCHSPASVQVYGTALFVLYSLR
jgi:hypothetical protein